jgi:hypothetical protein
MMLVRFNNDDINTSSSHRRVLCFFSQIVGSYIRKFLCYFSLLFD